MKRTSRRQTNPTRAGSATARERRFDAIQRRRNPVVDIHRNLLCYEPTSGKLTGDPQSPLYGLDVEIVAIFEETQTVLVRHPELPDGEVILPICPDGSGSMRTPPAQPEPPTTPPPDTPPEPECCYDVAGGKLRCQPPGGELDGLEVSLLALQPQPDGSIVAIVMSEAFAPGDSTQTFPVCEDPVVECCYDPSTEKLTCTDDALNGTSAGIIAAWTGPDGQIYVWAAWDGGAARMPLCPGTDECPPVFCCINLQTFTFICPGRPELNGEAAPLADVVTEDGYSWGILEDGSRVPMCGERCPPPKLCPDCPTCPPGQWLSPDGTCAEPPACPPPDQPCPPGHWRDPNGTCVPPPQCPECPPGTLLDTQTGECVTCPPSGKKEPCCDGCAEGGPCEGAVTQQSHLIANPGHRRKRRILSGNR